MLKIGILGSDNSHAHRFSEIFNREDHPSYLPNSGAQVVAIWGQEAERTQQVAQNGKISNFMVHFDNQTREDCDDHLHQTTTHHPVDSPMDAQSCVASRAGAARASPPVVVEMPSRQ